MIYLLQQKLKDLARQQGRRILDGETADLLHIDHFHLVFGTLVGPPQRESKSFVDQMEKLYARALEVRGGLTQAGASDLYLFIVGPPESAMSAEWKCLADEIEMDERVCRRLVWLPDKNGEDVDDFMRRTFLARPWERVQTGTIHTLSKLTDSLGIPPKWMEILLETDLEGRDLVESLMEEIGDGL